jgi:GNAT superfamily N-acetyltransferase
MGTGSSMQLEIRPARREDFPAWLKLWDGYNAFYGRSGETALPLEITQMTWSRFFDAYEPMHALVAEEAGTLLGLVHFLYHRSTTDIAPICYLQDLFTAPEVRDKGVGRALILRVYEHAKSSGAGEVYWQTHETNVAAMKLYDKVAEKGGFLVYSRMMGSAMGSQR